MLATSNSPFVPVPLARQVGQPPPRQIDLVVIHCSATPSGKPLQQGTPGKPGYQSAPQVIDTWHAKRGFHRRAEDVRASGSTLPSIGYHFIIDLDGTIWAGRGLNEVGAHALNFNARSVGICLVGGVEPKDAKYTAAQWASLARIVSMLLAELGMPCAAPKRMYDKAAPGGYTVSGGVCGHRDLSPDTNGNGLIESFEWLKTCPGFDVRGWLANGLQPLPNQICEVLP
jgi:N-acetylmuramoyl-L-alanine amidase